MIRRFAISAILFAASAGTLQAQVREVDQGELRSLVQAGHGLGLAQVLASVGAAVEGETVDVRVFDADGLVYSILIMLENGKMAAVFVDGETGEFIAPSSDRGQVVADAMQTYAGNASHGNSAVRTNRGNNGKAKGKGSNNGGGKGKNK